MADNKVLYGLKNCYYAKLNGTTYAAPVALAGAKSITLSPEGETSRTYADNVPYFVVNANNGYTGTLTLMNVPESFYTDVLGFKTDSKGNLVETADALGNECALLFQFEGDVKAKRWIFYDCKFARPSVEGNTKEDSIEPSTVALEFTAMPITSGNETIVKSFTTEATDSTEYNAWFTTAPKFPTFGA